MILEEITEVSNRSFSSHDFSEIHSSINIVSETKKPILLKKPKTKKLEKTRKPIKTINEEVLEKIKMITGQKTKKLNSKEKTNNTKKKTKKKEKITELEDIKSELEDLRIVYDRLESEYNVKGVDYDSLFSYLSHKANSIQDYGSAQDASSPYSLVMSDQEAAEMMEKVAISSLVGDKDNTSYQDREKISQWVTLNKTLCSLYEVLSPIKNRNIDYGKLN